MTNTEIEASHGTVQWRLDCRDIRPGEQVSCRPTAAMKATRARVETQLRATKRYVTRRPNQICSSCERRFQVWWCFRCGPTMARNRGLILDSCLLCHGHEVHSGPHPSSYPHCPID